MLFFQRNQNSAIQKGFSMFLIHNKPEQAPFLAQAILSACYLDSGWPSPAIPRVLMTLFKELLNYEINFENISPGFNLEARQI
jgi:hypothetical protein